MEPESTTSTDLLHLVRYGETVLDMSSTGGGVDD